MTTGTIVVDNSYVIATSCGNECHVRKRFSKVWSGVDGPRSEEHPYSCSIRNDQDTPIVWEFANQPGTLFFRDP